MGDGLTLVQTGITVVGSITGAIIAAFIGVYFTHCYRQRKNKNDDQRLPTSQLPPEGAPLDVAAKTPSQLPSASGTTMQSNLMNANDRSQLIRVGVWGHLTAENSFKHEGYDGIKNIKIFSSNSEIYSIEVQYTRDGEVRVETAGECPQNQDVIKDEIALENGDYINKVSGYYGPYLEDKKVRSLTFTTNKKRELGPYGEKVNVDEEDTTSFYVEGGRVVGFYGNAKNYILAIGFYVLPLNAREGNDRVKVGLWGKKAPHPFDHFGLEGIETLTIIHNGVIDCIKVKYRNNDQLYSQGDPYGETFPIDFDDGEYINKVIGYYGRFKLDEASPNVETINGLVFTTNKGRKLKYGRDIETWDGRTATTPFNVEGGRIVGFHGTSGDYISSIGFYVLPLQVQL